MSTIIQNSFNYYTNINITNNNSNSSNQSSSANSLQITSIINKYAEDLNEKEQFNKQLISLTQNLTTSNSILRENIKYKKDYNFKYLSSFNNWLRGIGDNYMFNNNTLSTCLFESIPFNLDKNQIINHDYLYHGARHCKKNHFSSIYDRIITVHCVSSKSDTFKGIKYYEYGGIFNGIPPSKTDTKWDVMDINQAENIDRNQYIIKLKDTTQTTWIECHGAFDFHISLLSLSETNINLYKEKKSKIKSNFRKSKNSKIPPNIVIFIIDSASRANFFRGAPESVQYLSELQLDRDNKSPSDILEFFRYSTVGWGTGQNLAGLIAGVCDYCSHAWKRCDGLATYYDRMGYNVIGLNEYRNKSQLDGNLNGKKIFAWQSKTECDFYLSYSVLPQECWEGHGIDVEWGAIFAKQAIKLQIQKDNDVPYMLLLHTQANHVTNGKFMWQIDRYIRDLIESIDKENTIIHLIADHGTLVGNSLSTIYGQWEMMNPVSIMILPKWLNTYKRTYGYLKYLKINQQRFVHHYDSHLFYKELLWRFYEKNDIFDSIDLRSGDEYLLLQFKLMKQKQELYQVMVYKTLPRKDFTFIAESIMDKQIALNRNCDGILLGYCFCDVMKTRKINKNTLKDYRKSIKLMLHTINDVTGNGKYECKKLYVNDFNVQLLLENDKKTSMQIVIERQTNNKQERDELLKINGLLSYSTGFYKDNVDDMSYIIKEEEREHKRMPVIRRIDYFKYEKCLTTRYKMETYKQYDRYFEHKLGDGEDLEPIFIDQNQTIKLLQNQKKLDKLWNLRLCHCKEQDIN